MEEKLQLAAKYCEEFRQMGFHCSESSIRACAKVLGLPLSADVLRCASGFRGGGGGYGDRCGIVEAGCMLVGYLYGRLHPNQGVWDYSYLIRKIQEGFQSQFGSIYCRDLLPMAQKKDGTCSYMYKNGVQVVMKVLLEAEELLKNIPAEEIDK